MKTIKILFLFVGMLVSGALSGQEFNKQDLKNDIITKLHNQTLIF